MSETCIIIGASHAAAQLVPSLRQEGWEGEILMIGDEPHLPYHRPPLSKAFLAGDKSIDDLAIRPAAFYEKNEAQFIQGHAVKIDRENQQITLDNEKSYSYSKLILCTGSRVRKANLPGEELNGVHYLRNIADVQGIQSDLKPGGSAVIVGGGYIGLETAASLRKQGMEVTVLEMAERVLQRVTAPALSEFYTRIHTEEGVNILTSISVTELKGQDHVEEVICSDGQVLKADLVVIGIGVLPNVELAQAADLEVDNGVVVDEQCRTQDANIYAAGDCTRHYNALYDCHLRLESVPNASEQAKVAAASICGKDKSYNSLPWFWSDQYDLKLQIAGLSQGYDQVVIRGDNQEGRSFVAFYFKENKLIAADCVNRPQEFILSKKILMGGLSISPDALADENQSVKELSASLA